MELRKYLQYEIKIMRYMNAFRMGSDLGDTHL